MTEAPLMNDEAARSPAGEILDQAALTTSTTTETPKAETTDTTTATTATEKKSDSATEPKPDIRPAVPEKYADFKAPDNYTLDAKALEAVLPVFKELGLTQDQAQRLVDIQIQRDIASAKGPQDAYAATRADWQAKTQADPELSKAVNGDKTGLEAVKLDIGRALTNLEPGLMSEFKQAMDITGAGDHPAFVKAMWKLSQFITEGKHVTGAGPSIAGQRAPGTSARPDVAHSLYPNLK